MSKPEDEDAEVDRSSEGESPQAKGRRKALAGQRGGERFRDKMAETATDRIADGDSEAFAAAMARVRDLRLADEVDDAGDGMLGSGRAQDGTRSGDDSDAGGSVWGGSTPPSEGGDQDSLSGDAGVDDMVWGGANP